MIKEPIYVTRPSMPPLDEFNRYLQKIWDTRVLTNNGPFHRELEEKLCSYLGVDHICLFSNGTHALITALQALNVTGEVITTPYSFVATSHALWWNNIKPVFVDIDPVTLNLDPSKIEDAITPGTTAVLPVHVYGMPCDTDAIDAIAKKHKLKLIYDAAHAFGVKYKGASLTQSGDLSILSFHATKVFNTFEGGAIICHDEKTKKHIDNLKNFGFTDETTIVYPGINAKMNEIQAAFGLLQLKYLEESIEKRRRISELYTERLSGIDGLSLHYTDRQTQPNYGYFPVFIDKEKFGMERDTIYSILKENNIYGRRYFYPLISQFPTYRDLESSAPGRMPVAEKKTLEVICLPIYPDLDLQDVEMICKIICKKG